MNDRKIRQPAAGNLKPAATRLKELSAEVQVQVMEILEHHNYQEAEALVEKLVGCVCSTDVLFRFRKWYEAMAAMEAGRDRVAQITEFLIKEMPEASPGKVRELSTMFYALMSIGQEDAKMFVNVSRAEAQTERERIRQKRFDLDERRFQHSLKNKLDAGLEALAKMFNQNPQAMEHFQRARGALKGEVLNSNSNS